MRLPLLDAPALALHLLLDAQLLEQLGLAAGAAGAGRVGDRGRREQLALEGVDRADAGLGRAAAHREVDGRAHQVVNALEPRVYA
jgi:hypothetical protein